jgi:hypothetical protein
MPEFIYELFRMLQNLFKSPRWTSTPVFLHVTPRVESSPVATIDINEALVDYELAQDLIVGDKLIFFTNVGTNRFLQVSRLIGSEQTKWPDGTNIVRLEFDAEYSYSLADSTNV